MFTLEKFKDYIDEIEPILKHHWKELARNQDRVPMDIDYSKYKLLDDMGLLHSVIARDEDGNVIGYFISFVQPHIHYASTTFAMNDVLYVKPDMRHTGLALKMFKWAEEDLKGLGVDVMTLHVKSDKMFASLCKEFGAERTEIMYSKFIGD